MGIGQVDLVVVISVLILLQKFLFCCKTSYFVAKLLICCKTSYFVAKVLILLQNFLFCCKTSYFVAKLLILLQKFLFCCKSSYLLQAFLFCCKSSASLKSVDGNMPGRFNDGLNAKTSFNVFEQGGSQGMNKLCLCLRCLLPNIYYY